METDRLEQFNQDVQAMKLKTNASSREGALQTLGGVLMAAGVVLAIVAYNASLNTKASIAGQLDASSYLTLAVVGLTITMVGTGMFLRYSFAKFLRLWLLRQSYENQANIERLIDRS
jgi:uncharacterized membrane protein YidH (DUF202 family)